MAELNKSIVKKELLNDEQVKMSCSMHLMGCLSDEDYKALSEAWEEAGGVKHMKWWEFIFKNVTVKYER